MSAGRQLPLALAHRPALGREDFLVAPGNAVAVAWIDRWPDWPGPGLALHGPPGCGKTHLSRVWRAASGACAIDAHALGRVDPPELLGPARACVLDGAEGALSGGPDAAGRERALLHLLNVVAERGGHFVLTGRRPPARWPVALPDLRSRLAALSAAGLSGPDDGLIEAVLVKLFADRQLRIAPEVVRFLAARLERSFAAARATVAALDRAALAERRDITIPFARHVLERDTRAHPETDG